MQQAFVDSFCHLRNGTRAARAAGYSERSAAQQAHALLRNPKIAEAIKERLEPFLRKADVTLERSVRELAAVAYAELGDVATWDGEQLVPFDSRFVAPEARRAIKAIEMTPEGPRIEMAAKLPALIALLKMQLGDEGELPLPLRGIPDGMLQRPAPAALPETAGRPEVLTLEFELVADSPPEPPAAPPLPPEAP